MDQILLQDPELAQAIILESARQIDKLELIASENFVSTAVLEAQSTILTNKYAEGYPGKRYYGGCEYVDIAENLAIERAKKLFHAEYANVQPHSGSQANMGAYFSLIKPGDTILGMNLSHGGHLTHGSPVNFSGKLFNVVSYGVNKETGLIDYEEILTIAEKHKPQVIIAGASAYPRLIDFSKFRSIADSIGAKLIVDMAHIAGLVATNLHPSPLPYAHITTTTTHKTLRGPRGGMILSTQDMSKIINSQIFPGIQGGPLMHIIAAKAVALGEALKPNFITYQKQVIANAKTLAGLLLDADFNLISGGTDNHLILVDLTNKKITGKDAEKALDRAGITVNKNTVPFETLSPFVTSGIRIGTPALTTRGFCEQDMIKVGNWIVAAIHNINNESQLREINKEVTHFSHQFPLFSW